MAAHAQAMYICIMYVCMYICMHVEGNSELEPALLTYCAVAIEGENDSHKIT